MRRHNVGAISRSDGPGGLAGLPAAHRAGHISIGAEALAQPWPELPASHWLDFVRHGNRQRFETAYLGRRRKLINLPFAECAEGRSRFLEALADGVWLICEESS